MPQFAAAVRTCALFAITLGPTASISHVSRIARLLEYVSLYDGVGASRLQLNPVVMLPGLKAKLGPLSPSYAGR